MKLESITVENYRQFEKAELTFDEGITILAGANNSGKTSLINLIKNIFVDDKLNYNMSDIPAKNMREWVEWVYPIFQKFFRDRKTEENVEKDLLNVVIPKEETDSTHLMKMTTVKIHVSYNPDMDDIKLFADCIMDLDETKHDFYFMYNFEIVHTQFAMKLAGTEESIGVETLDDYAVQKIIGWFQQQEDIDLELRSDIEFIYLPMLDDYSEVRPRALNTRLSLEPEYFCSLIELCYKERNGEKREIELNKSLSDRLYEILFQFKVIPGIDWNGNFDAKRFDYWMKTVKTWSRDNDRYEVAMHTVGSGLSYAELDEDKLPQTAVIEELNRVENEELRRGYYLGIINQRGVHWIDPEGKPELELAEDYENRANIAESRGYSRYAGILRVIGDEFKREAKSNILEAKNGDDE